MGLWWSRLVNLFGDQEARILVLGLDNAGKTTILCEHPFPSLRMCMKLASESLRGLPVHLVEA